MDYLPEVLIAVVISLIPQVYIWVRNDRVFEYRISTFYINYDDYKNLPSYQKMLWSLKPLKDKYWIKRER